MASECLRVRSLWSYAQKLKFNLISVFHPDACYCFSAEWPTSLAVELCFSLGPLGLQHGIAKLFFCVCL